LFTVFYYIGTAASTTGSTTATSKCYHFSSFGNDFKIHFIDIASYTTPALSTTTGQPSSTATGPTTTGATGSSVPPPSTTRLPTGSSPALISTYLMTFQNSHSKSHCQQST